MELTVEQFEQFDRRLEAFDNRLQAVEQGQRNLEQGQRNLEQGQRNLEHEITVARQDLSREIVDSRGQVIQWVIGLFIGSMLLVGTLSGVYISVLLAR